MDKSAIKKYAVWARRELIERVSQRALIYGITLKDVGDPNADSINGHLLSQAEKRQRQALIRNIKAKGFEQVMEEVAYTWFNRFAALRFMEVNGYLPSHIRVFTNDAGEFKPQILAEAIHLELDGLDMNKVYEMESANNSEELFKYLLIVQCNALNSILPGMFQRIEDYTELLLPDYLLREGSVIEQMVTTIPEEDWTDQVQIIGWLYQYYNTEPKDKVFADLKKNIKITKENIPAATQLFTPDWIVHYMVENSLGRLWLEGHPNNALKSEWKYYLDEAEQEPDVQVQLAAIRKEYAALKPEEIRVIDPCMGSGHILCVLFDVLVRIYEDYGYTAREAVVKIVENNLWGLEIDERAAQLSYFAVMMKARQYDRRFFSRKVQPHVYAIEESNDINRDHLNYLGHSMGDTERKKAFIQMNALLDELVDAKEFGSILQPNSYDWALLSRYLKDVVHFGQMSFAETGLDVTQKQVQLLTAVGQALAQKYHVVVTNPPYMSPSNAGEKLAKYVKKHFPNGKSDMFGVFIEQAQWMIYPNAFVGMITQHSWMFLSTFEKFRVNLIEESLFVTFAHLGVGTFVDLNSKVVQSVAFILRKRYIKAYVGNYDRLFEREGFYEDNDEKAKWLITGKHRYQISQDQLKVIPGMPIAYWLSKNLFDDFTKPKLKEIAKPLLGLFTYDNNKYLRMWFEVKASDIDFSLTSFDDQKGNWLPHNKGGKFRRWYGNVEYVVWYRNKGEDVKRDGIVNNESGYLKRNITWTALTTANNPFRLSPVGCSYDSNKGPFIVDNGSHDLLYLLGFLNSRVAGTIFSILNPTISLQNGDLDRVPIIFSSEKRKRVEDIVRQNVSISQEEWDEYETSMEFKCHPLVSLAIDRNYRSLSDCWHNWERVCEGRFNKLKANEEELNRIFIDVYGLQKELTFEVDDKDITVRRADLGRDIRSLISYAVGCIMGRYSINKPGLIYSESELDFLVSDKIHIDKDGIIPICDDDYFEDDMVGLFVDFIEVIYGKDTLEENLRFIASALDGKGSSREVIRGYFINGFYADHLKVYQKRPIYWMFDSGKKNGFKCLIYMHRYRPDTIARIRTDYVHEQQSRYRTAIDDLEQRIVGAPTSERVRLSKHLAKLYAQAQEVKIYEEKIHHLADQMIKINLDDGVKANYAKFAEVLAKLR